MRTWTLILLLSACQTSPPANAMRVNAGSAVTGQDVVVTFDKPLTGRATNQYWLALQPASAPDSDTTGRTFLDRSDTSVRLRALAPGDYEVRLHGQYPRKEHAIIARIPVKVHGWPVTARSPEEEANALVPESEPEDCLDLWLAEHNVDAFGSPQGTFYPGGTPLFDEENGILYSRRDYVFQKHPLARKACP
jgi:hypothetical protein